MGAIKNYICDLLENPYYCEQEKEKGSEIAEDVYKIFQIAWEMLDNSSYEPNDWNVKVLVDYLYCVHYRDEDYCLYADYSAICEGTYKAPPMWENAYMDSVIAKCNGYNCTNESWFLGNHEMYDFKFGD